MLFFPLVSAKMWIILQSCIMWNLEKENAGQLFIKSFHLTIMTFWDLNATMNMMLASQKSHTMLPQHALNLIHREKLHQQRITDNNNGSVGSPISSLFLFTRGQKILCVLMFTQQTLVLNLRQNTRQNTEGHRVLVRLIRPACTRLLGSSSMEKYGVNLSKKENSLLKHERAIVTTV